jgi:signal transduction histidine kinase
LTLQERAEELARQRIVHDHEMTVLVHDRDREAADKAELARLNQALAEADRRKDEFIAILGHELRNPLAPVRTSVDMLRSGMPLTSRMIEIMDRQTQTLGRLIDDLLNISRIKANKIELQLELVDLVDVTEGAIAACMQLVEQRGHALVFDSHDVTMVGDAVRLAQVVTNLVNNAARYTEPGGQIEVSCGSDGDHVFIRVSDSGIGVPVELQPTLFDTFVQERVASDGYGGRARPRVVEEDRRIARRKNLGRERWTRSREHVRGEASSSHRPEGAQPHSHDRDR